MVLSIRKISTENEDLSGAGVLWFKNLNEPDPYLILPLLATCLNYFNLGVSFLLVANNSREVLPKKMNIGMSIDFVRFSKLYSFSTCLLRISGQRAHSCTG